METGEAQVGHQVRQAEDHQVAGATEARLARRVEDHMVEGHLVEDRL